MPSLRKRVTSYFRQLSFHNESREKRHNVNENTFVTKYLQGHITLHEGPPIIYGKNPTDLPSYEVGSYQTGPNSIVGCYSGPNGGLTTVKRTEKHLSILDADIDFIDTNDEEEAGEAAENSHSATTENDAPLPSEWNRKSDFFYGISDSLYDRNQVTRNKNGDPIADCFGLIARNDSAILAVADGVNWGEKASIAAKSAVHGSLHYLNKTIFNDTKPFESLTTKTDETSICSSVIDDSMNLINNTREVFVCLLRAFNCAHDLILENKGMLTTLTVAVILPLKQKYQKKVTMPNGQERRETETQYVCCVCNVGDTLAYVYSQKYGIRELTKGSHDINCNRDMRDALGALGPVDGINPELSNLTLSITTLHKGDIVMVASDGLTDNFDPNVCKFTVNSAVEAIKPKRPSTSSRPLKGSGSFLPLVPAEHPTKSKTPKEPEVTPQKPPVKPPRKSQRRDDLSGKSTERSSTTSSSHERTPSSSSGRSRQEIGKHTEHNDRNIPQQKSVNLENRKLSKSASEDASVKSEDSSDKSSAKTSMEYDNPLIAQFMRDNSIEDGPRSDQKNPVVIENKASSLRRQASHQQQEQSLSSQKLLRQKVETVQLDNVSKRNDIAYKFLRSKTSVDIRSTVSKPITRNEDGVPYITPIQRYELQLLLIEDILRHGISGKDSPCTSARRLCENLVSYTVSITSAKRHTLEDPDLYYDNRNGVMVEVSNQEKKNRRKKGLERVQTLPGKLDHVTVVAYNVGNFAQL